MILDGETILPDDYPVYFGYAYVADGEVVTSDGEGTVADLKKWLNAKEVRRCSIIKRAKLAKETT